MWLTLGFEPTTFGFLTAVTPQTYVLFKTPKILQTVCASWAISGKRKKLRLLNWKFSFQKTSTKKNIGIHTGFTGSPLKIVLQKIAVKIRKNLLTVEQVHLKWNQRCSFDVITSEISPLFRIFAIRLVKISNICSWIFSHLWYDCDEKMSDKMMTKLIENVDKKILITKVHGKLREQKIKLKTAQKPH